MKFKLNSHVLINLSLAFSDQVVAFGITQKEYLLEIASKFKVGYICLFLSFDWLVDMLTIMLPELLFHLVIKLRELTLKSTKCLLADGEAGQISFSLIYEVKAFLKTSIEATNICWYTELSSEKLLFINFISNLVPAWLNKEDFKTLLHFVGDNLEFFEFPYLELVHKLLHEISVNLVVIPVKRVALLSKLPKSKERPEFPKEVTKQKFCVDLSLTLRRKLV